MCGRISCTLFTSATTRTAASSAAQQRQQRCGLQRAQKPQPSSRPSKEKQRTTTRSAPPVHPCHPPLASSVALSLRRLTHRLLVLKNLCLQQQRSEAAGVTVRHEAANSKGNRLQWAAKLYKPAAYKPAAARACQACSQARMCSLPSGSQMPTKNKSAQPAHSEMSSNLSLSLSGHIALSRSLQQQYSQAIHMPPHAKAGLQQHPGPMQLPHAQLPHNCANAKQLPPHFTCRRFIMHWKPC